jgi:hypothetical protein
MSNQTNTTLEENAIEIAKAKFDLSDDEIGLILDYDYEGFVLDPENTTSEYIYLTYKV